MNDMSVMKLFKKTLPFFIARIIVYALFALISVVFIGIVIGIGFLLAKMFGGSSGFLILLMVLSIGGLFGGLRFVERYFLYIVKTAHIAVVVELLTKGTIPEGKGQVAYGKEQITKNFGAANVAFAMDALIAGAVRQIQRWINRIGNLFGFIPGSKNIIGIINAIMSVSLNYIDEAIFSYIILRKNEGRQESAWKSGCDGVVLYAQSWKGIIKTSIFAVIFIYLFNLIVFVLSVLPLLLVSKFLSRNNPDLGFLFGFLAVVLALTLMVLLKRALIDPIVTIMMVRTYQITIRGLEPSMDLQSKLLGVSSKFKKLFKKSEEAENNSAV